MSGRPKRIMAFEFQPGKTLVAGVAELNNDVGALAEAMAILARMDVDLTQSSTYVLPVKNRAVWSFFGVAGEKTDFKKLEETLRASSKVVNCQLRKSEDGLLSDILQFPVWVADNQRVIVSSPTALTAMFQRIKKVFGSGGEVLLYEEGVAAGREGASILVSAISRERLLKPDPDVLGIYASLGWGKLSVLERAPDNSRVVMEVRDNFEALGARSNAPSCQFIRGVMAGFQSHVTGRKLSCVEVECAAAGKPACKFVLS